MSLSGVATVRHTSRDEGLVTSFDQTRIFWESEGQGPTVVLCDGIACDGFIWKYLRPALLDAGFRVLHLHWRGHGRSGLPRDPHRVSIDDHARDIVAVLDHQGVDRAALIAHSMGTQVALETWHGHPGRVSGLVLACGSFGLITRTFHGSDILAQLLPFATELADQHPSVLRALWSRGPVKLSIWFAKMLGEVDALRIDADDLAPYFEHVNLMDPQMFLRMLAAAGSHTAEGYLSVVDCPALVIAAERDTFTPMRYAKQMATSIPGCELLEVLEGSHTAPIEQPALINGRVLRFLRERVEGRDGAPRDLG